MCNQRKKRSPEEYVWPSFSFQLRFVAGLRHWYSSSESKGFKWRRIHYIPSPPIPKAKSGFPLAKHTHTIYSGHLADFISVHKIFLTGFKSFPVLDAFTCVSSYTPWLCYFCKCQWLLNLMHDLSKHTQKQSKLLSLEKRRRAFHTLSGQNSFLPVCKFHWNCNGVQLPTPSALEAA